jgi:aminomuconate-semialdehyde/2-hydroxymuconate-6-semialdehyde dehydrogenase
MASKKVLNFINGKWTEPRSGKWLQSINPSTGEAFSEIPDSNEADVNAAVAAAKSAFVAWSQTLAEERAKYLYKIADLVEERINEFAHLESLDQGKPVSLAEKMDINRVILNFRFFAGAILHHQNESTEMASDSFNYVLRKPVGVAGLISPWNLPLYLLSWKIAPAIACGNTVICKPSEFTSMTAALLCEVLQEVNLPAGVVNMVFGTGPSAGAALVKHPDVPLISFTGGTETGKKIATDAAAFSKKLSLELGGKNPNIIFADCDFDQMLQMTLRSSFLNQGEICLCGSRIYVEESIFDKFLEKFVSETKKLRVGDPAATDTFMGPVVSDGHFNKVMGYIDLAKKEGGKILCGGERIGQKGFFIQPTVIVGLSESSKCVQEEIFGPVVTVAPFKNYQDAIQKANGVKYGLSASVWTKNLTTAHAAARDLQVGTVWINTWLNRDLRVPFGGVKASGIGREGGNHSIEFFTEATTVNVRF